MTFRVLVYARYSSDAQREASIDDQFRISRVRVERDEEFIAALACAVDGFCSKLDAAHDTITGGQGARPQAPTDGTDAPTQKEAVR